MVTSMHAWLVWLYMTTGVNCHQAPPLCWLNMLLTAMLGLMQSLFFMLQQFFLNVWTNCLLTEAISSEFSRTACTLQCCIYMHMNMHSIHDLLVVLISYDSNQLIYVSSLTGIYIYLKAIIMLLSNCGFNNALLFPFSCSPGIFC